MLQKHVPVRTLGHGVPAIKVHEILLIWSLVLIGWYVVVKNISLDIENIEYLQWCGSTISIFFIAKHLNSRANILHAEFIGRDLSRSDVLELVFALILCAILGIGGWSVLILSEANLDVAGTYRRWGLISPNVFEQLHWAVPWLVVDFLIGSILVPITEEIIFRGFILRTLMQRHTVHYSIVSSSAIFAVFHADKSFIGAFALGIVFALLAVRMSSLYAPMLVHGLYNGVVFVLTVLFGSFVVADESRLSSVVYWAPELTLGLVGIVLLLLYLLRKTTFIADQV
jgi:membrane protease YdiL (CAAX protease family)